VRFDAFWQKNEKEMTNDVNTDPAITKMPLVVTNNADNRNKQLGSSLQMDWAIGDNHYLITGYDISYDTLKADTRASASTSVERILATGILASAPPFAQQIAAASMAKSIPYTSTAYHEGDMLTNAPVCPDGIDLARRLHVELWGTVYVGPVRDETCRREQDQLQGHGPV